jgi:hypothetical protein
MPEPVRARRLTDQEGQRLPQIVRRRKHGSVGYTGEGAGGGPGTGELRAWGLPRVPPRCLQASTSGRHRVVCVGRTERSDLLGVWCGPTWACAERSQGAVSSFLGRGSGSAPHTDRLRRRLGRVVTHCDKVRRAVPFGLDRIHVTYLHIVTLNST